MRTEAVTAGIEHRGGYRDAARVTHEPRDRGDDDAAFQRALDAQFGVTPREREELAAGCLPPRLRAPRWLRALALPCASILWLFASLAISPWLERGAGSWVVLALAIATVAFLATAAHWDELRVDEVREVRGPVLSVFADRALWIAIGATWFPTRWSSAGVLERGDVVRAYFTLPQRELLAVELIVRAGERASMLRADLDATSDVTLDDFRARFQ